MQHDSCPHCHTRSGLNSFYTLVLSLQDWPLAFLYAIVVLAFGEKFNHSISTTAMFISLAIVPVVFRLVLKHACDNCGVEFRADKELEQARVSSWDS